MAWIDTYGPGNKIIDEVFVRTERWCAWAGGSGVTDIVRMKRTITETHYRYTSMTEAGAAAGAAEIQAADTILHPITANAKRQNDADAYFIEVVETIITPWALES